MLKHTFNRSSLIALILFIFHFTAIGQSFKRQANETAEQFALKTKPDSLQVAHTVIETAIWGADKKVIIALFGYDAPDPNKGFNSVFGYLYYPTSSDMYSVIALETIGEDGGLPEVISVFFANADGDKAKELGILCKYVQRHHDYSGELYKGFIYDNPTPEKKALRYDEKLLTKFSECDCDFREGESTKARFKTAQDIKVELTRMGY